VNLAVPFCEKWRQVISIVIKKTIKTFESSTVSAHRNVPRETHLAKIIQLKRQTAEFG